MTNPVRSGRSPTRALPDRPNLEHLRKEAKSRLKRLRETDPTAQLAIAQLEVARQYGFQSWRRLQADVSKPSAIAETETPEERLERLRFDQALPRRAVSIDPSVLERYVGVYELNPKTIITVQRDGDGLIARLTGQMFFSLDPESTRKFFYRNSVLRAQLSFLVEPDGTVTAAVLHQNGHERTAARVDDDRARTIETLREERQSANTPEPGSEAALRRIIVQTRDGVPDDDLMSDGLARHFKEQLPDNKRLLASWGHLISVTFIGVSKVDDSDVYDVVFASALTEWRLTMEGPETIGSASFRVKP